MVNQMFFRKKQLTPSYKETNNRPLSEDALPKWVAYPTALLIVAVCVFFIWLGIEYGFIQEDISLLGKGGAVVELTGVWAWFGGALFVGAACMILYMLMTLFRK